MVKTRKNNKRKKRTKTIKFDNDAMWLGPKHKKRYDRYILKGGAGWDGSVIPRERIKILYDDVPRREVPASEIPELLKTITGFANLTDICPIDLTNQPEYILKACRHAISSHAYGELARSRVPPPLQFGANLMFNCPVCRSPQVTGGPLGGVWCPAVEKNPGLPFLTREPGKTRSSDKCETMKLKEVGGEKSKYITLPESDITFTIEVFGSASGFEAHIILPKPRPKRGGKTRKRRRRKKRRKRDKKKYYVTRKQNDLDD